MARSDYLFTGARLSDALEGHARGMDAEIERAPEDHLLSADVDQWAAALLERYRVEPAALHPDQWSMDPPAEIRIDVSGDHMRAILDPSRPFYINGFLVRVRVPFTGEADLFGFAPNSFDLNPPAAEVVSNKVVLKFEYPHDAPRDVRAAASDVVQKIEKYLGWIRAEVEVFNDGLDERARRNIQARRDRVKQAYEHLADTGIPMRKHDEASKTYIAEALVRLPSPTIPPVSSGKTIELEPVLSDKVFDHILGVIRSTAESMERSPKTYSEMGEDDRRQVLVAALNTHYRGQTAAEAFNMSGKTDILVRYESRNLFIGECKIWSGSKEFSATVDQLFSYAAWRDTKLAVIMFVKERALTEIVAKGREILAAHDQFVSWEAAEDTELRATMSWPGDERRHADLNVFFVHTPT